VIDAFQVEVLGHILNSDPDVSTNISIFMFFDIITIEMMCVHRAVASALILHANISTRPST